MKKIILIVLVLVSMQLAQKAFSQIATWSPLKRLTTGYKDSNPAFGPVTFYYGNVYYWEFLVFQRQVDTSSQICVLRINKNGALDTVRYLTNNNYKKRNPAIAYRMLTFNDTVKYSLAVWETNQNGKWDIYGSYYSSPAGWTSPFPIDSGAGNKYNPKTVMFTANEFGIIYSKDDDIIYRRYNAASRIVLSEINFSSSISSPCGWPLIAQPYPDLLAINFRYQKTDNSYGIYRLSSSNGGTAWSTQDTAAYIGNNVNVQIAMGSGGSMHIFESSRSGKSGIYSYSPGGVSGSQEKVLASSFFNYYGLKTWFNPVITDLFPTQIFSVIRKSSDSTKVLFYTYSSLKDSVPLGDTSKNVSIALNQNIRAESNNYQFYIVFNKDTAGFTSLYYKTIVLLSTDIRFMGNIVVKDFKVSQNYPNPFNPATKIKFDIPKLSDVKIIIFDAVGREVKNISQNNLNAGSYEYEFNGENLSSGIYYFRFQAGEFSNTVKMVLMK